MIGKAIGAYRVVSLLGKGGMGEVYRATDTLLKRDVALKVLPKAFAADASQVARFQREAEMLAAINHPHIAQIFGLEATAGISVLVMELVEGLTLADLIERDDGARKVRNAKSGLRLNDVLTIAGQIAQALEAAHAQGIIHRDLKPSNIKVRPDGTVKLLDFGLAKVVGSALDDIDSSAITTPAITQAGVILGTVAYMSPEQVRGQPLDRRADIWAFGCVLYEMLTGRLAFPGDTASDRLAAVLERQPDWNSVSLAVSGSLMRVLKGCLEKDPARRWRDIADVRRLLEEDADATLVRPSPRDGLRSRERLVWGGIAALLGSAALAAFLWPRGGPGSSLSATLPLTRLMIVPPIGLPLAIQGNDCDIAIAPDGTFVVYRGGTDAQLIARRLDQLDSTPLTNVRNARVPFVSPDGRWIGYVENNNTLRKVAVSGGSPISLATIPGAPRGAAWIDAATIVVATNASGLLRVPADGGEPTPLTTVDRAKGEREHRYPSLLPGGTALLYTIAVGERDAAQIAVLDLRTLTSTPLIRGGSDARYVASGHLLYTAVDSILAVPFDSERRVVLGGPVPLSERVSIAQSGALNAAVTHDGVLVYVPVGSEPSRTLIWADRNGEEEAISIPAGAYVSPRLSPDGNRVALDIRGSASGIGVWDFARQTLTRLGPGFAPIWTADGRRLVFANQTNTAQPILHARGADGLSKEIQLTATDNVQVPTSATPAGDYIISDERRARTGSDIVRVPIDRTTGQGANAESLVDTPFAELNGDLSPDGSLLAFESNEHGRFEIYVAPYPQVSNGRWQLSVNGGTQPLWTSSSELAFLDGSNQLNVVAIERDGPTFRAGAPTPLPIVPFRSSSFTWRAYDVSRDGKRFLIVKERDTGASLTRLVVVQNIKDELKRLAPR